MQNWKNFVKQLEKIISEINCFICARVNIHYRSVNSDWTEIVAQFNECHVELKKNCGIFSGISSLF